MPEHSEWRRLSPLAIVYFVIKFTVNFIKQGLINILPAVGVFLVSVENKGFWLSIIVPSLLIFMILFGTLYYWFFTFRADDKEILIHRGIFSKERLNLQLDRVQNVNIATPFYFSPFHLVNCIIESAGSKSTEVNLPGVSEIFALQMRDSIFENSKKKTKASVEDILENNNENSVPVLKLSNWESAKSGLTSYLAFIILASLTPFMEAIGNFFEENIFPQLMEIVKPIIGNTTIATFVIAVFCVVFVFSVIVLSSVLGAFIRFYNFELYNEDDKLIRISGLLERRSTTLTKVKIQSVFIKQNVVARLLDRVSVGYRQVGSKLAATKDSGIHIPMLLPEDAQSYIAMAFADYVEPELSQVHSSYIRRVFIYYCLFPVFVILAVPTYLVSKAFLLIGLVLVPLFLLIRLRYRRYGFWFNHEYCVIRSGVLGKTTVIFPLYKIQLLKVRQSKGQSRLNVGNLRIQLGSGILTIPYVPMDQLEQLINLSLYEAESSKRAWI